MTNSKLTAYQNYKETGLPWVGRCPAHWSLRRMKYLVDERVEKGYPDEPLLTASQSRGVIPKADYGSRTVEAQKDLHLLKLVEPGDYVISLRSFQGGIEFAHVRGIISPAYTVLQPKHDVRRGYYEHFFKSSAFISSMTLFVTGIREGQNIDYVRLSRAYMPVPPPDEQDAIGRFIRHLDQRVNRLIKTKRRLIELLNEQKQAIIHRAVIRGLDPTVSLKPSGIDWLGDIPAHWTVARIKHLVRMRSGDGITAERIEETGEFPVYGGNGLRGFTDAFTHVGDYILIGRQGALCGNIQYASGKFWASEHAVVCTPIKPFDQKWLGELLKVMNLNQYSISAAQPGLAVERIKSLQLPLPPIAEQEQISLWFLEQTADLELVLAKARSEIDLIQEYRTRLVADVVTGQLDVRHLDLPEVEESLIEAIDADSDEELDGVDDVENEG